MENGYFVLEAIRKRLEELLNEKGHKAMLFPLVATEDNFSKEATHIKGFSSEVFVVSEAGEEPLERKLIVRPTSETIIYPMFKIWIRSHADLPMKVYQSGTIYRYETKATRPLLRVREIPWNEAHTAHSSIEEAEEQMKEAVSIYRNVFDDLCLGYIVVRRPDFDKFAGADYSIAFDAWNPDGKVVQIGTVHNLGCNFSKVFEIDYERPDGTRGLVYQTCYGLGYSRTLAAMIAQHGDDRGIVFPPKYAPKQVVIVPILYKGKEKDVTEYSKKVYENIKEKFRTVLDDRNDVTPGEKYYHWEMMGVPVRIEVGPKEVEEKSATLVRRDTIEKVKCSFEEITLKIDELFNLITDNLRYKSKNMMKSMVKDVHSLEELSNVISDKKIARVGWCGKEECAMVMKQKAGGDIRGYRIDKEEKPKGKCIVDSNEAKYIVYVARSY